MAASSSTARFELFQTGADAWWTGEPTVRWGYAMGGLEPLRAASAPIVLDAYVDHTFGPGKPAAAPHTRPWLGFVHHTFDTTYSQANCTRLFSLPAFLASLPTCKGLIALSKTLQAQLRAALDAAGFPGVPAYALTHPTPMPAAGQGFTWPNLLANPAPRAVQVGCWMRNARAICDVPLSQPNPLKLRKAALLPYTPHLTPCDSSGGGGALVSSTDAAAGDVTLLPGVTDAGYQALLRNNLVFLNLVDASAVNTVLECIANNTPVIVNRLPALEEALGTRYLGFYTTLQQAADLMTKNYGLTLSPYTMYVQRTRLDKTPFLLGTCVAGVTSILEQAAHALRSCEKGSGPAGPPSR